MARKKNLPKPAKWRTVVLGALLFVGLGIGLITVYKAGANDFQDALPAVASGTQLEASRQAITQQYLTDGAANSMCGSAGSPVSAETFYKYLRVNVHNDRAVIRGCNNADLLLAKINGKWQKTEVNMNLDTRVNPDWQQACDITDITIADTVIRPENQSIDATNLKLCKGLQDNKILDIKDL
jgi:hypothetical protein